MEQLEHPLWIVQAVNALLGPLVAAALHPLGFEFEPGRDVIPNYVVMSGLIVALVLAAIGFVLLLLPAYLD